MKIRLMGSTDLVRAWSRELERAYGLKPSEYPSRNGERETRVYFEMDDRLAASIVGLVPSTATASESDSPQSAVRSGPAAVHTPPRGPIKRSRRSR